MSDDARDDELGDLDDALFGDGDAKPAPPRDQAPKADIDWFAGIEEPRAAGGAGAGAASGADVFDAAPPIVSAPDPEDFPDLVGDAEGSPDTEWVFQEEPAASAAPDPSTPDAEGPIVDAAIFGAAGDPPPQPLSRRELNARRRADRRRRVLTLVLVVALTAVVGVGIAAVLTGGSNTSAAKSEVKVIGTELPTTTPSTRPTTTAAPATAAPTTPPATAAPAPAANNTTNRNTTPVRTNPPPSWSRPRRPPIRRRPIRRRPIRRRPIPPRRRRPRQRRPHRRSASPTTRRGRSARLRHAPGSRGSRSRPSDGSSPCRLPEGPCPSG